MLNQAVKFLVHPDCFQMQAVMTGCLFNIAINVNSVINHL